MKSPQLIFCAFIAFLLFGATSCSLVEFEKPWEIKNEMLEGKWDLVSYRLNGEDFSHILNDLTFVFTPSEAFPQQGKYETYRKNKRESIDDYEISDDGQFLIFEQIEYAFDVTERTLNLRANPAVEHVESVELVFIRN